MLRLTVDTPTGPMTLTEKDGAIVRAEWESGGADDTPLLRKAAAQLVAYFDDPAQGVDLPLEVEAAEFPQRVCEGMFGDPAGGTRRHGGLLIPT